MTKRRRKASSANNWLARLIVLAGALLVGLFVLITGNNSPGSTGQLPTWTPAGQGTSSNGGGSWQVAFTEPGRFSESDDLAGTVGQALLDRITAAQESVHIAAFEFDLDPLAEALIAAHERGLDVKWVTDDEYGLEVDLEPGRGQFARLQQAGIEVRSDGRSALMHDKFIVLDGRTVWTGSTNLTRNGIFRNNNNVLIVDSAALASVYEREFAEMWAGAFGPTSPSTIGVQSLTVDGTPVQVLFAPEDQVLDHLLPIVESARESLRFMAFSFTSDELAEAIIERAQGGVDVQGIMETRGSETPFSELSSFVCAGVPVRQDGNPATFHHKVIIVDDRLVVTGSFNFTASADEQNDENTLIVSSRDIASRYVQEFQRRWAEARNPEPGAISCG